MKDKEQIKALQNLVIQLNAYIPHNCYNCIYSECELTYCSLHDRSIFGKDDGCSRFEMKFYENARKLGVKI